MRALLEKKSRHKSRLNILKYDGVDDYHDNNNSYYFDWVFVAHINTLLKDRRF